MLIERRAADIASAERVNASLAIALEEQTSRTLGAVDYLLRHLVDEVQVAETISPASLGATMGTLDVHGRLQNQITGLDQIDTIGVIAADGQLLNTSGHWPVPLITVENRQYFRDIRDHPSRGLLISEPILSRTTHHVTIYLARPIIAHDGTFVGAVMAAIRADYFANIYRAVSDGDGRSVALRRRDSMVLSSYPDIDPLNEATTSGSQMLSHLIQVGAKTANVRGPDPIGGSAWLGSARALTDFPLVVMVGQTEAAVLAEWRQQTVAIGTGASLASIALIAAMVMLTRQIARRQASEQALQATLDNTVQGVVMIDTDRRVSVCNRRAMQLLDLPPELMAARPFFDDVLRFQSESGDFGSDGTVLEEAIRQFAELRAGQGKMLHYERRRPNGTILEVSSVPLANGAVVKTYTDVTSAREREAALQAALSERDEAEAALRQQRDSLERELAERSKPLIASEARLRDMTEVASDWNWETDANQILTFISKRFGDTSGIPWEQVNGRSIADLVALGFDPAGMAALRTTTDARGIFHEVVNRVDLPDGGTRFWRLSGKPFFHAATGAFSGYRGTGTDVTAAIEHEAALNTSRLRAEEAEQSARQARSRLVEAIEAIPEGFILHDAEDRLVLCNARYGEIFQLAPELMAPGVLYEDTLRSNVLRGYHVLNGLNVDEWVAERMARHRAPDGHRDEYLLSDGRWMLVEERRTSDGGTVGIKVDVTETRLRETAAREHDRTIAELQAARLMQTGLLPSMRLQQEIADKTGLDIASRVASCSELGGDLWGISDLGEGRVGVYIVDFAGHGTAAALNTFRLHTLIHELRGALLEPARFLSALNMRLVELLPVGAFATMFYAVIDPNANCMTYSVAGSTPPILRCGKDLPLISIDSAGIPLGIAGDAQYVCSTVPYGPGAMLFLYSDMLTDFTDEYGHRAGEVGAFDLISSCASEPNAEAMVKLACAPFLEDIWLPLSDDLTVVCIMRP